MQTDDVGPAANWKILAQSTAVALSLRLFVIGVGLRRAVFQSLLLGCVTLLHLLRLLLVFLLQHLLPLRSGVGTCQILVLQLLLLLQLLAFLLLLSKGAPEEIDCWSSGGMHTLSPSNSQRMLSRIGVICGRV